jgi:hypothetical protein
MAAFLYRCSAAGLNVQGYVADNPTDAEAFEPISCIVCARVHLVSTKTGKVQGADDQ